MSPKPITPEVGYQNLHQPDELSVKPITNIYNKQRVSRMS